MKISPISPSSYSPVRRKTLCPPMRASCVKPQPAPGQAAAAQLGRRGDVVGGRRLLGRRQRLAELAAVAVERHRLEAESPRLEVDVLDLVHRGLVRQVHGLADGARDERLRRRHHPHVAHRLDVARAARAAAVGAVEHGQVLGLESRGALDRLAAADHVVGGLDLGVGEAEERQGAEARLLALGLADAEAGEQVVAEDAAREREAQIEHGGQQALDAVDLVLVQAALEERRVVDVRRALERAGAERVPHHALDLGVVVAEPAQRPRHRLVHDLEVPAAGQLLELHQREIGLDAGGVAVHQQSDRAGRREHGGLGVAVAVPLAEPDRLVPALDRGQRAGHAARGRGRCHVRHRGAGA